jgi:hypothetical protein
MKLRGFSVICAAALLALQTGVAEEKSPNSSIALSGTAISGYVFVSGRWQPHVCRSRYPMRPQSLIRSTPHFVRCRHGLAVLIPGRGQNPRTLFPGRWTPSPAEREPESMGVGLRATFTSVDGNPETFAEIIRIPTNALPAESGPIQSGLVVEVRSVTGVSSIRVRADYGNRRDPAPPLPSGQVPFQPGR